MSESEGGSTPPRPREKSEGLAREAEEDARAARAYPAESEVPPAEPPRGSLPTTTLVLIALVIALVFFLAGIEVQKLLGVLA